MRATGQLEVDADHSKAGLGLRERVLELLVRGIGRRAVGDLAHAPVAHAEKKEARSSSLAELHVVKLLHHRLVDGRHR